MCIAGRRSVRERSRSPCASCCARPRARSPTPRSTSSSAASRAACCTSSAGPSGAEAPRPASPARVLRPSASRRGPRPPRQAARVRRAARSPGRPDRRGGGVPRSARSGVARVPRDDGADRADVRARRLHVRLSLARPLPMHECRVRGSRRRRRRAPARRGADRRRHRRSPSARGPGPTLPRDGHHHPADQPGPRALRAVDPRRRAGARARRIARPTDRALARRDVRRAMAVLGHGVPRGVASMTSEKTLATLEFTTVRGLLAERTSFTPGREQALELAPETDLAAAERLQDETTAAKALVRATPSAGLRGAQDIRDPLRRADLGGILDPEQLVAIAVTVRAAVGLFTAIHPYPPLAARARFARPPVAVADGIEHAIGGTGEVLDRATVALAPPPSELPSAHPRLPRPLPSLLRP